MGRWLMSGVLVAMASAAQAQPTAVPCDPACSVTAGRDFVIMFDVADAVTSVVLVIDTAKTSIPLTASAGSVVELAPRNLTAGNHPAQVGICNEFGCSAMTPFEVRAGDVPVPPSNPRIRIVQAVVDGLRILADKLELAVQ